MKDVCEKSCVKTNHIDYRAEAHIQKLSGHIISAEERIFVSSAATYVCRTCTYSELWGRMRHLFREQGKESISF